MTPNLSTLISSLGTEQHTFYPSAYTTAWVSRVPQVDNLLLPAFPQSLQWLRTQQLSDGSWGTNHPRNPFANTLATLASLLALKQWDREEDQPAIERALQALTPLALACHQSAYKTFGFELILFSLVDEALAKKISLSPQALGAYEMFLAIGRQQHAALKTQQQRVHYQTPSVFWLCLEMLGGGYLTDPMSPWPYPEDLIAKNGSLLASVSATAYFLAANRYRGRDIPKTYAYLTTTIAENKGGASPYYPMEQYELAFALDFLLKGDMPLSSLKQPIKRLRQAWQKRNGLGYSVYSPSLDADDCALGLIILKKAGMPADYTALLQFFNGDYFSHYKEDPTPSISVNANVLRALQIFRNEAAVKTIRNKVLDWLKAAFNRPLLQVFQDSWHVSPYYSTQAIIFALAEIDTKLTDLCVDWLIAEQRDDGGWGYFDNTSSLEETALAILALAYYRGNKVSRQTFLRAEEYLIAQMSPVPPQHFYMGTTMVYPIKVVAATIAAAQYAIRRTSMR